MSGLWEPTVVLAGRQTSIAPIGTVQRQGVDCGFCLMRRGHSIGWLCSRPSQRMASKLRTPCLLPG